MALQPRPDGELIVVSGASRSGKTAWTNQATARDRRVLVWDSVGEFGDRFRCRRLANFYELREACRPGAPIERAAFFQAADMGPRAFEIFCRFAWVWLRTARGTLIVEELAGVTSPGKAPAAWGQIARAGLRYGPRIFAITQRPAESDKTAIGNATLIHCHQLMRADDERYMARELRCDPRDLERLAPLEWIERDRATATNRRGKVRFARPARA